MMDKLCFSLTALFGTLMLSSCASDFGQFAKQVIQDTLPTTQVQAQSPAELLMKQGIWQDPRTGLMWDRCAVGQSWNGKICTGEPIKLEWQDAKAYLTQFTNTQAKGGYTDWRLPTIQELASIRNCYEEGWQRNTQTVSELTAQGRVQKEISQGLTMKTITINGNQTLSLPEGCQSRSIKPQFNTSIFPNNLSGLPYWSSSYASLEPNFHQMWSVDFTNGVIEGEFQNREFLVRAVRSE